METKETTKINVNVLYFKLKKLSTTQIRLLALIEEVTLHRGNFTLTDQEIAEVFGYTNKRQCQFYIKDLCDKGIISRYQYGFYDHSRKEKSGFVKKRNITINYDKLESYLNEL